MTAGQWFTLDLQENWYMYKFLVFDEGSSNHEAVLGRGFDLGVLLETV